MAVYRYSYHAVTSPVEVGFLGIAASVREDGSTHTLFTSDEEGELKTFATEEDALEAIGQLLIALMSFRFKPNELSGTQRPDIQADLEDEDEF